MSLGLPENGLRWKHLWPFKILGKLYVWENSGSQVITQNVLNQSYMSILTSVELVNQISLSVCRFVYLSVSLYVPPFLENNWLFFVELCIWTFETFMRWSQTWKNLTPVTHSRRGENFGLFLPIFVHYFFSVRLLLENGLTVSYEIM